MIKYAITAYHRPHCSTLAALLDIECPKERILVYVNCEEDASAYPKRWGDVVEILYKKKNNVAGNRNNVLDRVGEEWDLVILDDDILSFRYFDKDYKKSGRWIKMETIAELDSYMEECFQKSREIGASMFGTTSVTHCLNTKQTLERDGLWSVNKNFQGGFCGFIDRELRYDETYDLQDDYELNLRIIKSGGKILRRNGLTAYKPPMAKTEGGCKELYESGLQPIYLEKLRSEYPGMVKINKNGKGIRFAWR